MKTSSKTLLLAALIAVPFTAVHAADEAWLRAQKIDIQPTLKITETEIPADSSASSPSPSTTMPGTTGTQAPSTYQPSMPSTTSPSSSGGYAPASPSPSTMPSQDRTPGYITPGVNSGAGVQRQ
ncbi:hypothetical protein CR159_03625 [Pollutimonas subterranea]|uniref:Uncharacterized protein n=1 Tax=Pollutimonas subterranea TaxID=2045210 RepID=A0A2N4U8I1_9BURK|nr:hypothetical protein [Pollutimonas subterranea]PLC51326.1 hypothetical protein CR159_03625 [Pollutimonas subterranea]